MTRTPVARRMFDLVEPIGMIPFFTDEPYAEICTLGFTSYWDTYFAGRAAPLGASAPAEVVHAVFYNFAPGEAARHVPKVWSTTTPEAAHAARDRGAVKALRRILGPIADSPDLAATADLLVRAATGPRPEGRPLYAALRALPVPTEPLHRLWHAATLLREHRGDGHVAALLTHGIGGLESHALHALSMPMPAERFGRIHHLPAAQVLSVLDGMRDRGLIGADGWLTDAGHACKQAVEDLTDTLAEPAYDVLDDGELDRLVAGLQPIAAALQAELDAHSPG